jgi:membrane-associated phospholipid phosphatase
VGHGITNIERQRFPSMGTGEAQGRVGGIRRIGSGERVDDRRSFPSQAASKAFATIRLSNRNLDSIEMPPWLRTTIKSGNYVAASGAAWARVEGERHYPSDVLAGACLGNLVTTFIHDAFMNLPEDSTFSFYIEPSPSGVYAAISFEF